MAVNPPKFPPAHLFAYLSYLLFRLLTCVVNSMSGFASARLAEGIGSLLYLRKRRRDFCAKNLHQAFPNKSEKEIHKIGRASMQSLMRVIFEFIRLPLIAKNPSAHIEIQGEQHVWDALREKKGVILIVSHFGNWELAGIAAANKGIPLHAIGKPHKNKFVDQYIKRLRGLTGLKTIDKEGAVQKCIRLLKQNQVIAMLIDEHAKKGAVWPDFFGQKAATSSLPAILALKYGAVVLPADFYREKKKRSVLVFGKPFPLVRTQDAKADILSNTQKYMEHLQRNIKKRPEDWILWMHNRWRWNDILKPLLQKHLL